MKANFEISGLVLSYDIVPSSIGYWKGKIIWCKS